MKLKDSIPVVAAQDVRKSVDYYVGVLGFTEHFVFGNPPVYAGVERDGVLIYVCHDPKLAAIVLSAGLHPEIFLWVQDVDALCAEHRARGAHIVEPLTDRPWDARQYVVREINGYHLKIAEPTDAIDRPRV